MLFNYFNLLKENYYFFFVIISISLYERIQPQFIRSIEYSIKEKNKYITTPQDLSIALFEMGNSYSNIHVDFGKPQQQVTVIRDAISVKLKLTFQIYCPLKSIYESVKSEFCYKPSILSESSCNEIPRKDSEMKWFNMNFNVRWLFNKTEFGFKLTVHPAGSYQYDLSGFYYFKSSSPSSGIVLSNFLEMRDILFWKRNTIKTSPVPIKLKYTNNLNSRKLPVEFQCLDPTSINLKDFPYWATFTLKSVVDWAWCPVSKQTGSMKEIDKTYLSDCLRNTILKCERKEFLCPRFSGKMSGWTETVSFDGTLTLSDGIEFNNYGDRLDGYALMCYYQTANGHYPLKYISNAYDSTEKEFAKGIQWIEDNTERNDFTLLSPINQTIKVGALMDGFTLNAFYHFPKNFTFEWFMKNKKLASSNKWHISTYSLKFNGKATLEMEGFYFLKIRSSSQSFQFTIYLKIISPPVLINIAKEPILSTVYLMINSNFSINYFYKGDPTHANIYINGFLFKPLSSDRKVFLNDLAQKSFNLQKLDFYFVQKQLPDGIVQFTYGVKNVLFPQTLLRGQDHNVIIEAVNEYGVSRSLLNIYVLKPPKFENLPQSDNCTAHCSSEQPHLFRCELNSDYYTTREILVEKFWLVNDIRLDSLPYHSLYFKDEKKGLNLMPVKSNISEYDTALKLLLKNAKLICRVRLLYPGSIEMTDTKLIRENRIIYDTFSDSSIMNHFAAEIKLDWKPDIIEGSHTWIIFLSIAILLIVMFIFLLVKFTLKGQGKSYQIEKLEIAKGYNRDEEIFENETIKPYLRSGANNTNNRSNHPEKESSKDLAYSSLNYSPPNGNGKFRPRDVLDIIDDEETAIDPSKFNEEGSFIGVYATKNNHSNLPPEIKINKL